MFKFFNIFFILLSLTSFSISFPTCNFPKYRLSGNVKPTFYSIKLQPNLEQEIFTGEVTIHIKIDSVVDSIHFHLNSTQLKITSLYLDSKKIHSLCLYGPTWITNDLRYIYSSSYDIIKIVRLGGLFVPGSHIIHIKYNGKFSQTTNGIFKATSSNNNKLLDHLIATDLEPSHARKVFPCFDEPAFKAKFQVNLVVPNNSFEALSNMEVLQTYPIGDGIIYKFKTTPVMSSYLLSFAIIKKNCNKSYADSGINYNIYTFEESGKNDTRLLEFASKMIKFYTNYTNFSYILSKLDFIGFDRYESTATENWGLITFNSSILSSNDDIYVIAQKQSTIAHELAHSWFGNLVTNDWWDDIWLHESFATFMSIKAEDAILENKASLRFPVLYSENLFYTEQTLSKTPVVNYEEKPLGIYKNFNDITYIKGAAILRMVELVIGEDNFRKIMIDYIHKFAFKTVTTNDLLQIIEDNGFEDVREFMESYLYQTQFPIFYVEEDENDFIVSQNIYKIKSENYVDSVFNYRWTVPVTYVTNLNSSCNLVWFYKDRETLTIPKNNASWIKLNFNEIGYYRVNYSEKLWNILIENNNEIEFYDRDHFLLNAIGLFEINIISCDIPLTYLWELSNTTKSPHFNMEIATLTYARIDDIINNNIEASVKLKIFFVNIFKRIGKHKLATHVMNKVTKLDKTSPQENQISNNASEQTEACINWLLNNSTEYTYINPVEDQLEPIIIQE